jgi:hypothetical protein
MAIKLGVREGALSAVVFSGVMFALLSVDPRVRDHLSDLFGGGASPWTSRLGSLGDALWTAARSQSIDNAPMVVFAAVGVVLTLFMLRS